MEILIWCARTVNLFHHFYDRLKTQEITEYANIQGHFKNSEYDQEITQSQTADKTDLRLLIEYGYSQENTDYFSAF